MEPCQYIRLTVGNLAIKPQQPQPQPQPKQQTHNIIHPTTSPSPYYCMIKLKGISSSPIHSLSPIPHLPSESPSFSFHISKSNIKKTKKLQLKIYVYSCMTRGTCGVSSRNKELGKVSLLLGDLFCRVVNNDGNSSNSSSSSKSSGTVLHNGWTRVGKCELHFVVRVDPDPRFVFEFDGEPECSPQVFQVNNGSNIRQLVFSCKFSFCYPSSHQRSRSFQWDQASGRGWVSTFGSERERPKSKDRKGWSITVHDLSGSPVALASMLTPFVASPGSDRVSRSNPGSWLILRPGEGTWTPWGRLEAWRESASGSVDGVGLRFELIPDMCGGRNNGLVLGESTLSTTRGGKFSIDLGPGLGPGPGPDPGPGPGPGSDLGPGPGSGPGSGLGSGPGLGSGRVGGSGRRVGSAMCSPRVGSNGAWKGFVMEARVEGEGKCSRPRVEVSAQHVTCTEDAAAYVALAAAVDLSMDACRLFSQNLRKELCQSNDLAY